MDLTTVDVSGVPGVGIGDEALLLGEQDGAVLDARDLAKAAGTIPVRGADQRVAPSPSRLSEWLTFRLRTML